jgi:hypothetical protein
MARKFTRTMVGTASNFDPFRKARKGAGNRSRKKCDFANMIRSKPVRKQVVPGAIKKIDSLQGISAGEKKVARAILKYVTQNPEAFYDDIKANVAKEFRGETIIIYDKLGRLIKSAAGDGMVNRLCKLLVAEGLLIDPVLHAKLLKKLKSNG